MPKRKYNKPIYKTIPIFRLLLPLIAGILLQYHLTISITPFYGLGVLGIVLLGIYQLLSITKKFANSWLSGIAILLIFLSLGGIISFQKNIEHRSSWIGKYYQQGLAVKVTLQEQIVVKPKSYKALAKANAVLINGTWQPIEGDVLLYFKKNSTKPQLSYGNQIIIASNLAPIINAGNPGGFNYARYSSFQNIHYQAFLNDADFVALPTIESNFLDNALLKTREKVLSILRTYITTKNELAIAEALLIGYRDNLDRDLVQGYSNTGIVHIIAISGLHLGMIYVLLLKLFSPFGKRKWITIVKPIFILAVLWAFAFTAGAGPSILRSAIMFSFIVIGESLHRKSNMFNSLCASAFCLLIYNPFNLWDVGFQLSYTAVLSILLFQKHINQWLYFDNKFLRNLWSLSAVSIAAQILTLPIVLYHFHQFPTLFLFTNIVAVPLSGLILYAEIFLLVVSFMPLVANALGFVIEKAIWCLNMFVEHFNQLPFVVWPSIQINIVQTGVLYGVILCFTWWFIEKKAKACMLGLSFLLIFLVLRSVDFIQRNQQQKLVVYNVPNHTAIDLIEGRKYVFIGDSVLTEDGFLRNFHIKPSRVLHRITPSNKLMNFHLNNNLISCNGKNILVISDAINLKPAMPKIKVDAIILTKNPRIYLSKLIQQFDCNQYVFDSSNPFWKVNYWKKDADSLGVQYHSTATQGAFEMSITN
ncbi:MAG: ComEC family competence protein [Chitinophagaceae bacterium]|jgi:competence protein ComEC|nr:ComEC family competence protein [Chitinophagaceae bacterium]